MSYVTMWFKRVDGEYICDTYNSDDFDKAWDRLEVESKKEGFVHGDVSLISRIKKMGVSPCG